MNTIKQRAHAYAVEHQYKTDGVSLMRAYVAGASDERQIMQGINPKVFISGKVSGLPRLVAYGNFANKERELQQMGYATVNPMKICKEKWSWLRCMAVCLWHILWCDKVCRLDNWQDSRGARIEYKFAKLLKKKFI